MKLGNYELQIVGGTEDLEGYVGLVHGQQYKIRIANNDSRRCDAKIIVDGTEVGVFSVSAYSYCEIEHPVHSQGMFTFYELVTEEAKTAELRSSSEIGFVQATFMPEKTNENDHTCLFSSPSRDRDEEYRAGGTGLSGHSEQQYTTASAIEYTSSDEFVTISLRLGGVRPSFIQPLKKNQLSNAIPPPPLRTLLRPTTPPPFPTDAYSKSQMNQPASASPAGQIRIEGWLTVFCVSLTILTPLTEIIRMDFI